MTTERYTNPDDEFPRLASIYLADIASARQALERLAVHRPILDIREVMDAGQNNVTDQTFRREVEEWMRRYDSVDVTDLPSSDNGEQLWELVAWGNIHNRYSVVEVEADADSGDDGAWCVTDEDGGTTAYDDEDEATEEAERLNREHVEANLNGFPFAWNTGWVLDHKSDIQRFADAGFLVYRYNDDKLIAGIDGGGYGFFEAHWVPMFWAMACANGWTVETDGGPRRMGARS